MLILYGDAVLLDNGLLVKALCHLPAQERKKVYLSLSKRLPQNEIGRRGERGRSTAGYHIRKAIQRPYEQMGAHEE